jgi:hypothetical protein
MSTGYSARNWNKALLTAPHNLFSTAWHREFHPLRFQVKASFKKEKKISKIRLRIMSDTEVARVSTVVLVSLKPPITLCLIPN